MNFQKEYQENKAGFLCCLDWIMSSRTISDEVKAEISQAYLKEIRYAHDNK